jgi:hypothetical protein
MPAWAPILGSIHAVRLSPMQQVYFTSSTDTPGTNGIWTTFYQPGQRLSSDGLALWLGVAAERQ